MITVHSLTTGPLCTVETPSERDSKIKGEREKRETRESYTKNLYSPGIVSLIVLYILNRHLQNIDR